MRFMIGVRRKKITRNEKLARMTSKGVLILMIGTDCDYVDDVDD